MSYLKIFVTSLLMLVLLLIAFSLGSGLIDRYNEKKEIMFHMTVQAYQEEYNIEEDAAKNKVLIDHNSNVKVVVIPQIPEKLNVKID